MRWEIKDYDSKEFNKEQGVLFAMWHNQIALAANLRGNNFMHFLVSPHSDGRLISEVVKKFGFKPIYGSTNKNSAQAIRSILKTLEQGNNVVVTPDGPRGPVYQINSNITAIAQKFNKKLMPMVCHCSNYFTLNSWDNLIIPLPFSKITITIGTPITLSNDKNINDDQLIRVLNAVNL